MKNKLIYVFFTVAALICCFACTASADFDISYEDYLNLEKAQSQYECFSVGDVNGDGKVSALDARTVLRISVDLDDIATIDFNQADTNNDNKLTAADARGILRLSVKLDLFPEHSVVELELLPATCSTEGLNVKICISCMTVCAEKTTKTRAHVENRKWQIVDPANCQHEGKAITLCKFEDCGAIIQETTIPKTGHSGEWTYFPNEKYPSGKSCYDPVNKERYCEVCGFYEAKTENPPGAHTYKKVTVEASCFKDGEEYEICTHCENVKNEKILPQIGKHNTKTETVLSTCTVAGEIRSFCTRCDEVFESEPLPIAEHNYNNSFKKQIQAETCTEDGISSVTCINCGFTDEIAWPKATGHNAPDGWTQILEPTCTTEGAEEGYCITCYETVTQPIAATGHTVDIWTNVKPATCQEEGIDIGYCTVCGDPDATRSIEKTSHDFDREKTYIMSGYIACEGPFKGYFKCKTEGCTAKEIHDFDKLYCTNKNKGQAVIYREATCTEDRQVIKKCDYCGKQFGGVLTLQGTATGHNHDEWQTITEATCIKDGIRQRYCRNAGCQDFIQEIIPATGHTKKDLVVKKATCTTDGYEYYTCEFCDAHIGEITLTDPDAHSDGERIIITDPVEFDTENNRVTIDCDVKCEYCKNVFRTDKIAKINISPSYKVEFIGEISFSPASEITFTIDTDEALTVNLTYRDYNEEIKGTTKEITATDGKYTFTLPSDFNSFDSVNIDIFPNA